MKLVKTLEFKKTLAMEIEEPKKQKEKITPEKKSLGQLGEKPQSLSLLANVNDVVHIDSKEKDQPNADQNDKNEKKQEHEIQPVLQDAKEQP